MSEFIFFLMKKNDLEKKLNEKNVRKNLAWTKFWSKKNWSKNSWSKKKVIEQNVGRFFSIDFFWSKKFSVFFSDRFFSDLRFSIFRSQIVDSHIFDEILRFLDVFFLFFSSFSILGTDCDTSHPKELTPKHQWTCFKEIRCSQFFACHHPCRRHFHHLLAG
mgnify:CR=1 FL=1